MLAPALFVIGLVLVAASIGALAGIWWGVLAAGVMLVVVAVLTQLGTSPADSAARKSRP